MRTVRSSKLSLVQSMVEDFVLRTNPAERGPSVPTPLDHPAVKAAAAVAESAAGGSVAPAPAGTGGTVEECVRIAGDLLLAKLEHRHADAARLEEQLKFGSCDPEWLEVIDEYEKAFGPLSHGHAIPYVTYEHMDDFVLEVLPEDATIALVGDWGTGTGDATALLAQIARHDPDVLIHLGDIYYSGTPRETHARFLDPCNSVLRRKRQVPVFTLSGNHDMYSGGDGYYGLLPSLNAAPEWAQRASFFCLRTPSGSWQLLAMDTGLHDHDPFTVTSGVTYLEPAEAAWHLDKIERFTAAGGRTILLSHHQLFSASEYIGEGTTKPPGQEAYNVKLLETFGSSLGDVAAWFWGHEHNLCIYEPYGGLDKGRCIGHGAIPVYESSTPYRPNPHIPGPPALVHGAQGPVELPATRDGVYAHGYVVLDLAPSGSATARYYVDSVANPIYEETI